MKTFEKLVWAEISVNTEGTWDHLQLVFDLVMGVGGREDAALALIYLLFKHLQDTGCHAGPLFVDF